MKERRMMNLFFLLSSGRCRPGLFRFWPAQLMLVLLTFHLGGLAAGTVDSTLSSGHTEIARVEVQAPVDLRIPEGARGHELMDNREVQAQTYRLFRNADRANTPHGCSVWVTSQDGKYGFVPWSRSETDKQVRQGGPPHEAVAVIRISQTLEDKQPSSREHDLVDGEQSKNMKMPLYVVRWNGIWKLVPGRREAIQVRDSHWLQEFACAKHPGSAYDRKSQQCAPRI